MKLKIALLAILATINLFLYGQNKIQGYILDKTTGSPLSYATIGALHQPYGCYSDTSGKFTLYFLTKNDSLKVSYIGYKSLYTSVHDLQTKTTVFLESNPIQLKEVVVTPKKSKPETMEIGFFTKKRYSVLASSFPVNIHAIFIPFPENCGNVLIKSVKFTYEVTTRNYPMRLRILKVKPTGEPGDDIVAENIILDKKKTFRLHVANVDISKYNIFMPREGIFIALEWIMDQPPIGIKKLEGTDGPYIGLSKTATINSTWIGSLNQLNWEKKQTRSTLSIGLNVINYRD